MNDGINPSNPDKRSKSTALLRKLISGLFVAATLSLLIPALSAFTLSETAHAKSYKNGYKQIRVTSRYNPNKSVVVAVRPGPYGGHQVRLPTGLWVDCAGNCHWTVQKEYLDFYKAYQDFFGPGYIRFYF